MIKTYISTLLVVLLVGAQVVQAQEGMDDVFAQLDAGDQAAAAPLADNMDYAEVESSGQAPLADESETLDLLLKKGLEQYKDGQYDASIRMFDAALAIDKYNKRAVTYRQRAAKRIARKAEKKKGASRAKAIADINAAWNPEPKVLATVDASEDADAVSPAEQAIDQMISRLKAINIPRLDFTDAALEEVVLYLTDASRRNDSSGKGVNILLAGMDSAEGERTVTTVITDINLFDALQVIAEMASLKFEVKAHAVAIVPVNYAPASEMIMKSYDVDPEVGSELESFSGDSGGMDDLFGEASSSEAATGPVDVAGFFSIVEFPEGSSAIYRPRFHKLFVKNAPQNLKAIEDVLADLNERAIMSRSLQVEIEAKFVEFSEGALEELGFDWNVYGSGSVADKELDYRGVTDGAGANSTTIDPITDQPIYADHDGRPGQNVFGSAQRNNTQGFSGFDGAGNNLQTGLLGLMGGTPATMLFNNGDVDLQISAMEQEGTADVLTAPRVIAKSGSEAIIRVAETHRYPQDYDVETGQNTSPVLKPQDWEDVDLGVSLKVTPEVDPESNTINLDLEPEVMDFRAFDEYLVGYNGYKRDPSTGLDVALIAKMPYFYRRLVSTQVTISDGHTVVLGGLVNERTETFRDQVPILGDIPYLGRLFRTEGSRSAKKNLTIFVKATQIDVNGMTATERELARQ